jgi:hypothetical protein
MSVTLARVLDSDAVMSTVAVATREVVIVAASEAEMSTTAVEVRLTLARVVLRDAETWTAVVAVSVTFPSVTVALAAMRTVAVAPRLTLASIMSRLALISPAAGSCVGSRSRTSAGFVSLGTGQRKTSTTSCCH